MESITICPSCFYGNHYADHDSHSYTCPRPECGHQWNVYSQTVRLSQVAQNRIPIHELVVVSGGISQRKSFEKGQHTIGREPDCGLILDNLAVSRRHARLSIIDDEVSLEDMNSSAGTLVNGVIIKQAKKLQPGDQIYLAGTVVKYEVRYLAAGADSTIADQQKLINKYAETHVKFCGAEATVIPLENVPLTFGRQSDRDVVLTGPMITGKHAVLEKHKDGHYLCDIQTLTGTYVNGKPIIRAKLFSGDRIQIGPYLFSYEGHRLVRMEGLTALAVSCHELSKDVGNIRLLDKLTFELAPGEFVGLIGPSGAGKSTLLDALNGLRPATAGSIYLNQDDLYADYDRLKQNIGYVPQDDTIHRELTIEQAWSYAARLRLPGDLEHTELSRIIDETLKLLELSQRRNVPVHLLSGGQRKRVSVGVELLSRPAIIYLDEPTSGLDPGTESKLMNLFRRLADQGRTIICTTHVMENIDLFHKIVVLAKGGKLAYFGPPGELKAYFGIKNFCDLYEQMDSQTPDEWQSQFKNSPQYRKHIVPVITKLKARKQKHVSKSQALQKQSLSTQLMVLISRFVRVILADRSTLKVTLAQPVIITGLICLVCQELPIIFFLMVISSIWFGCSGAAQQIVKEKPIYRRERMVNLRIDAYIISKLIPLVVITTIQILTMMLIVVVMEDFEGSKWKVTTSLLLAAWSGVGMGLLISALASNADKAMSFVPLSLIPQIILAGVLVQFPDMNLPTKTLSYLTSARWSNQACEIAYLDEKKITPQLIDESNLRLLRNLYLDYDFKSLQGRNDFLQDHQGKTVSKNSTYTLGMLVLCGFSTLLMFSCGVILKRQDSL